MPVLVRGDVISGLAQARVAGCFLETLSVPLVPIIMGMILGPMAEQSVRRALLISRGDPTDLMTRPVSAVLAVATILVIAWPLAKALMVRKQRAANPDEGVIVGQLSFSNFVKPPQMAVTSGFLSHDMIARFLSSCCDFVDHYRNILVCSPS